ncbi:MAG: RbsD/FucU domain-containing protein [Pseudomonadota bacterium]
MLIGIDPLLRGEILDIIRDMGHGETLSIVDCNYPAFGVGVPTITMDTDIVRAGRAILSVFPLDSFVDAPLRRMEVIGKPDELVEAHQEFISMVKDVAGPRWQSGSLERFAFYEEAKSCTAVIATLDRRSYANFILTKGVIGPDGKTV